jgi:hypothetical protein
LKKNLAWILGGVCGFFSVASLASPFPLAQFYPTPVGILYPGFSVAGGVNPAALPTAGEGSALQLGFSGADGEENQAFGGLTHSNTRVGMGVGYQANLVNSGVVHNAFAGLGAKFQVLSLGIALRDYDLSAGISPSVDAGLIVKLKGVEVGFVFYQLETQARMAIGIGTRQEGSYALEANVLLPPFSYLDSNYLLTVSAQLEVKKVTAYFRTSYYTASQYLSHTLGLGVRVSKSVHLGLQYSTPRRIGGAITVHF